MKQALILVLVLSGVYTQAQNNATPVVKHPAKATTHKIAIKPGASKIVVTRSKQPKKAVTHTLNKDVTPKKTVATPVVQTEENPLLIPAEPGQNLQKENELNNNDKPGKLANRPAKSSSLKKPMIKPTQPPQ